MGSPVKSRAYSGTLSGCSRAPGVYLKSSPSQVLRKKVGGRRRPFLLFFAIPYGAGFLLFWWAPPIHNQVLLALVVCLAFILALLRLEGN